MPTEGVWCFIICFGVSNVPPPPVPADTYCTTYRRIVLKQDELTQIMKLSRPLRDRIQGNDLDYLCRCMGWKNKACRTGVPK